MTDPAPLAMFPLEWVLLPGEELALRIFELRYTVLVAELMRGADRRFGVVLISRGREVGGGEQRCDVAAEATITACDSLGAGRYTLRCQIGARLRVCQWLPDDPYPRATVVRWPDQPGASVSEAEISRVEDRIFALHKRIALVRGTRFLPSRNTLLGTRRLRSVPPGQRLYSLACRVPMGEADRYAVLAAPSVAQRLAALSEAIDTVAARVEFQLAE